MVWCGVVLSFTSFIIVQPTTIPNAVAVIFVGISIYRGSILGNGSDDGKLRIFKMRFNDTRVAQ